MKTSEHRLRFVDLRAMEEGSGDRLEQVRRVNKTKCFVDTQNAQSFFGCFSVCVCMCTPKYKHQQIHQKKKRIERKHQSQMRCDFLCDTVTYA